VVYDEKVQNQKHLLIQRSRWFSAHYQFAFKYFLIGWQKFFSEWNIDLLNKTIQHTLLPRSMTFVAILILAFFAVLTGNFTLLVGASVMFSLMTLAMALATPKKFYTIDTLHAIAYLPFTLVTLIHAALIAKPSQKAFDHTPHHDLDTDHQ
jgi:ribose/xylose/arabinose/galactoside ABC-type transport system permease subunit